MRKALILAGLALCAATAAEAQPFAIFNTMIDTEAELEALLGDVTDVITSSDALGGDLTGSLPNPIIGTDAVALGADTTGDYVSGATTGGFLERTGSEGASLGLVTTCSPGDVPEWNGSSWACDPDDGGVDTTCLDGGVNCLFAGSASEGGAASSALDLSCTDCIGPTEITDSYLLNSTDTLTGDLTVTGFIDGGGEVVLSERSSDPANPSEGRFVLWMSDGTGTGDDGDVLLKVTAGGSTKTVILMDFSQIP